MHVRLLRSPLVDHIPDWEASIAPPPWKYPSCTAAPNHQLTLEMVCIVRTSARRRPPHACPRTSRIPAAEPTPRQQPPRQPRRQGGRCPLRDCQQRPRRDLANRASSPATRTSAAWRLAWSSPTATRPPWTPPPAASRPLSQGRQRCRAAAAAAAGPRTGSADPQRWVAITMRSFEHYQHCRR